MESHFCHVRRVPIVLLKARFFLRTRVPEQLHKSKIIRSCEHFHVGVPVSSINVGPISARRPDALLVPAELGRIGEPDLLLVVGGARADVAGAVDAEEEDLVGLAG